MGLLPYSLPVCPNSVCLQHCVAVSQSKMVLSFCPDVTNLVQGLIDRQETVALEPICYANPEKKMDRINFGQKVPRLLTNHKK